MGKTLETKTIAITIDAPFERVAKDLADPATHPEWATTFFASPATPKGDGTFEVDVPSMGGPARMRMQGDVAAGVLDLYLARPEEEFGPPLPIRVLRNGDGTDVLFTLARFPGMSQQEWEGGIHGMRGELENLKRRHE